jgi:hypothetical protein
MILITTTDTETSIRIDGDHYPLVAALVTEYGFAGAVEWLVEQSEGEVNKETPGTDA